MSNSVYRINCHGNRQNKIPNNSHIEAHFSCEVKDGQSDFCREALLKKIPECVSVKISKETDVVRY